MATIDEIDLLGPPYRCRTLDLGTDEEGPVVATLVWRRAPEPTSRAVLWVHGWSDYFFQTHVADYFVGEGYDFYAIDLRKYGRSLREHQTPTFCHRVEEYFPELDEAARIIRDEDRHRTLLVAAHSTGGLIAALWAHRRRAGSLVDALFLNSPFFDLNLPALLRAPAAVAAARLGRRQPYGVLRRPTYPVYGHSLHTAYRGEWSYELAWKPVGGFPIRFGWLAAVHAGQRQLHSGLSIDVPVLVASSTRTYRGQHWHALAHRADAVLDVADIVRWAPQLGRHVTLLRVDGGMHDLTLSAAPVRAVLFSELSRWTAAYAAGAPPETRAPGPPPGTEAPGTEVPTPGTEEPTAAEGSAAVARTAPTAGAAAPADPG